MQKLHITHRSRHDLATLYARLADHNGLSSILIVPVKRIRDGKLGVNDVGSVRRIGAGPLAIEETVTGAVTDRSIDYRITRGGFPIRNHRGHLEFRAVDGGSQVDWTIQFDSALPLAAQLVKRLLGLAIGQGLKRLG